jgi:hypothetical protein
MKRKISTLAKKINENDIYENNINERDRLRQMRKENNI